MTETRTCDGFSRLVATHGNEHVIEASASVFEPGNRCCVAETLEVGLIYAQRLHVRADLHDGEGLARLES